LSQVFSKSYRLRARREFLKVKNQGRTSYGSCLIIEKLQTEGDFPRLGITVIKRFGKAHQRVTFKRRVREIFRKLHGRLPAGLELSVKARPFARRASYQQLELEMEALLGEEIASSGCLE
jgi:ribonuclease P protein component